MELKSELDMAWYWKSAPESPMLGDPFTLDTATEWSLHETDVDLPLSEASSPSSPGNLTDDEEAKQLPTSRALLAQQLLEDIDNIVKKEAFTEWFESKELPIFEEIPQVVPLLPSLSSDPISLSPHDKVPLTIDWSALGQGHLTPPQTPPQTPEYTPLVPAASIEHNFVTILPADTTLILPPPTPIGDLAVELAVVDEVVRDTAQRFIDSSDTSRSSSDVTSDDSDPEWMPMVDQDKGVGPVRSRVAGTRRGKPYNVEDKRLRKKEQNKNAATRYRLKKKAEVNEIKEEEKVLEERNGELEGKIQDVQREISYLKGLMREMFRAKGLIK